jgi:hypothetical protein
LDNAGKEQEYPAKSLAQMIHFAFHIRLRDFDCCEHRDPRAWINLELAECPLVCHSASFALSTYQSEKQV